MASSSAPLSPSRRGNTDDAPAAKRAKPAERSFAPLASVRAKEWQLQVHICCETSTRFPGSGQPTIKTLYHNEAYCSRDLVLSGNCSLFDLVKASLCAFGLNKSTYEHANGQGKLDAEDVYILDVVNDKATGPIMGLGKAGTTAQNDTRRSKVLATELKKVRLAQVLDQPVWDTSSRKRSEGTRSKLFMMLTVPARVAFVSTLTGGAVEPADECVYSFCVRCDAIGTKADMKSAFQKQFPRCTGASGVAYGGSQIDWECDDGDGDEWDELDELNVTFGNQRQPCGAVVGGEDTCESIVGWLRQPLFRILEAEEGEGQPSPGGKSRGTASHPAPAGGGDCVVM